MGRSMLCDVVCWAEEGTEHTNALITHAIGKTATRVVRLINGITKVLHTPVKSFFTLEIEAFRRAKALINIASEERDARLSSSSVIDFPQISNSPDRFVAIQESTRRLKQDLRMGREYQEGRINWITSLFMATFHIGAIAALFFFSWKNLAVAAVM